MGKTAADAAFAAGVVGAGGAGFPAHIKLSASAEYLLINGAEWEPLLHKDKELLKLDSPTVIKGAVVAAESVGAKRVIIGLKEQYPDVVDAVRRATNGTGVEIRLLGNYYPSGDEYNLTYECTGRLIPPAGIPLQVGCVVFNVETLYNVARAVQDGIPVTEKYLTIGGAVEKSVSVRVPVGMTLHEAIAHSGAGVNGDHAVIDGGAMMGQLRPDLSCPVTKTSGGYIVLPLDHYLVRRRMMTREGMYRKGHSACDQCTYCTELCPRFLLGYEVEPHKVMRSLLFAGQTKAEYWSHWGQLCCECNLCSLYACPEDLDPKDVCAWSKQGFSAAKLPTFVQARSPKPHLFEKHRKVPLDKLVRRLGLEPYDHPAPFAATLLEPQKVVLPLKQHSGKPCLPIVTIGQRVAKGQTIARVADGELGAPVHASIDGRVQAIGDTITIERD